LFVIKLPHITVTFCGKHLTVIPEVDVISTSAIITHHCWATALLGHVIGTIAAIDYISVAGIDIDYG
jgi:hypothetical protein